MERLFKCVFGLVLALCLMFGTLGTTVYAEEVSAQEIDLELLRTGEIEAVEMPELQTSGYSVSFFSSSGASLKDGNYVEWIDRVDLPEYATDFYAWLEENATANGVLADPSLGEAWYNNGYAYTVGTITDTVDFTYTYDAATSTETEQTVAADAAWAMVEQMVGQTFSDAAANALAAYSAFDRDHPEVFWLSGRSSYSASYGISSAGYLPGSGTGTVTYVVELYFILQDPDNDNFDIRDDAYLTVDAISADIAVRDNAVNTILSGDFPASGTRQQKIQYVNEYLTTINCYNTSADLNNIGHNCRECIGALTSHVGTDGPVCEAYARAFKVLCDQLGIPCVLVDGTAISNGGSGAHMWNYVQMEDGKWYGVDVTWNDPSVYGVSGAVSGYENENYLLVGSETEIGGYTFITSHPVSNVVTVNGIGFTNGPVLSETAYVPQESLLGYTLSLEGNIGVNFYMTLSEEVLNDTGAYLQFTVNNRVTQVPVSEAVEKTVSGQTCYVFTCEVTSKEMTETINAQMVMGDGTKGNAYAYTVKSYADYVLNPANGYDEALQQLVKAMLHYGGYAQTYFGHNTDKLANAGLTDSGIDTVTAETLKDFARSDAQGTDKVQFMGSLLVLESETTLRLFFSIDESVLDAATFTYQGQQLAKVQSGSYYYVDVENIVSNHLDENVTVTVSDGSQTENVVYNTMNYCYNVLTDVGSTYEDNLKNLVKALYLYNQAANTYFG